MLKDKLEAQTSHKLLKPQISINCNLEASIANFKLSMNAFFFINVPNLGIDSLNKSLFPHFICQEKNSVMSSICSLRSVVSKVRPQRPVSYMQISSWVKTPDQMIGTSPLKNRRAFLGGKISFVGSRKTCRTLGFEAWSSTHLKSWLVFVQTRI